MKHSKIHSYLQLMRLNKPIGIFLLLWPTLMALWIAGEGKPDPYIVSIFVLGVIVMRSAGCVINDIADRKIDKAVIRTKQRPLVTGALTLKESIILFVFLILIAFFLVLQLNFFTIKLSILALLLAILYPFTKRYTHFPQVILGAAFGFAVPMAFAALTNYIPLQAILLYLATLCWAFVYDTEYAMVDRAEDIQIGVKSTAIWLGKSDRLVIGILQIITLALLTILGSNLKLGIFYFSGILFSGILVFYQQYLIKDRDRECCFRAFLNNNLLGALWFSGLALDYCLSNVS